MKIPEYQDQFFVVNENGEKLCNECLELEFDVDSETKTCKVCLDYDAFDTIIKAVTSCDVYEFVDNLIDKEYGDLVNGSNFVSPDRNGFKRAFESSVGRIFLRYLDINRLLDYQEDFSLEELTNLRTSLSRLIPITDVVIDLLEDSLCGEAGEQHLARIWCSQLQNFIDKGSWHVGLKKSDGSIIETFKEPIDCLTNQGEPIMWFGMKDQLPLKIWTVKDKGLDALIIDYDSQGEDGRLIYSKQLNGEDVRCAIDYESIFEFYPLWYFVEAWAEGASFHKVIDSCPIDLLKIQKSGNGTTEINNYIDDLTSTIQ